MEPDVDPVVRKHVSSCSLTGKAKTHNNPTGFLFSHTRRYNLSMPEPLRLRNAPITEALLDIRVKLPPDISLKWLERFQDSMRERYPAKRVRTSGQISVKMGKGGEPPVVQQSGGPDGYLFTSQDGKQIVQARLDGFTFNRLKPYESWQALRDEARELWRGYVRTASPEAVTRIALRYINRIEIPLPMRDFKDYILTTPEIAPQLPQGLNSFLMRLVIQEPKMQAYAIVTQTMEPIDSTSSKLPLIFDIDVFRNESFEIDSSAMWSAFEILREFKNTIFFNSITDRAKELFS